MCRKNRSPVKIFPATHWNVTFVKSAFLTKYGKINQPVEKLFVRPTLLIGNIIDLPISIAGDSLLLPADVYYAKIK